MKRFVEIAGVAVAEHLGDHLNGKLCVFQQQAGFFHALFQEKLGKSPAGFFMEVSGYIVWMITEMGSQVFQRHGFRMSFDEENHPSCQGCILGGGGDSLRHIFWINTS